MSVFESELVWVVCKNDQAFGPLCATEIKTAISNRELAGDDPVWKKGWSSWKLLKDIPFFTYECQFSPGEGRALPEIEVPDEEQFKSVVAPMLSVKDVQTGSDWTAKRIAVVSGAALLFGPIGAVGAAVMTKKSTASRLAEEEKDRSYIKKIND